MILEPIRIISDWLNSDVKGFNDVVKDIPCDLDDVNLRKPCAFIADSSRDDRVARMDDPPSVPALYVTSDGPLNAEGEVKTIYRDSDTTSVAIRYVMKGCDTAAANAQVMYALRAVVRSLRELMRNENAPSRTRNGIYIESCLNLTFGRVEEGAGSSVVAGAVVAVFKVRDKSP